MEKFSKEMLATVFPTLGIAVFNSKQLEVMSAILTRDVFAILPTGF